MAKTLEERVEVLETRVLNLDGAIMELRKQGAGIADLIERSAKTQDEFMKKVNESERETIKVLNDLKDNLLFASVKGRKPA